MLSSAWAYELTAELLAPLLSVEELVEAEEEPEFVEVQALNVKRAASRAARTFTFFIMTIPFKNVMGFTGFPVPKEMGTALVFVQKPFLFLSLLNL